MGGRSVRSELSGRRVLVTGGTGSIGARLVERLVESNAAVRVLVRDFMRAFRIARFPIEFVRGDVTDSTAVAEAVRGCDVVVHCAYGSDGPPKLRRAVNIEGTRNVLEAAVGADVRRVVHLSTMAVYGTPDGEIIESSPRRYRGEVYSDSKVDAERLVFKYGRERDLDVVVLQPTVVYGPFVSVWTERVLANLLAGRQILVNGGNGLCNAVYVDDVVDAILLAMIHPAASGEAFLISGEVPVTWRDFFGRFEQMIGRPATISMTADEAKAFYRRSQPRAPWLAAEILRILRDDPQIRPRLLRTRELSLARRFVPATIRQALRSKEQRRRGVMNGEEPPELPIRPLHPLPVDLYAAKTVVRIDKAKRILGYRPVYDLEAGMARTEAWARWANLLPAV